MKHSQQTIEKLLPRNGQRKAWSTCLKTFKFEFLKNNNFIHDFQIRKTIVLNNTFSINQIQEELKTTIVIQLFLAYIGSRNRYLTL